LPISLYFGLRMVVAYSWTVAAFLPAIAFGVEEFIR